MDHRLLPQGGHVLNGQSGIEYLLNLNAEHAKAFIDTQPSRREYRVHHPTEIAAAKCMDGRLNLSLMTKTPPGIIQPWRNLGGMFRVGWPHFNDVVFEWEQYAESRGRKCLIFTTYHFSRGDEKGEKHRGCAGLGYKTEVGKAQSRSLKRDLEERAFRDRKHLYVIQAGIDTDLDALVLHGEKGEELDLATIEEANLETLRGVLKNLFPSMASRTLEDLLPIIKGNIEHVAEIRASNRPVTEVEHKEDVLAFGRGFDWLHTPNKAIIVGPFDADLKAPIATAADLILRNINEGRVQQDQDIVLLVSSPYYESAGSERPLRELKAEFLVETALATIKERVPKLYERLKVLVTTIDMKTRRLDVLYRSDRAAA